ncbi:hypothetical protein C3Y90_16360 [Rhizobium sp. UPM1134]|nr:hypothetical protein [Rhizobium ruizarguesonis]
MLQLFPISVELMGTMQFACRWCAASTAEAGILILANDAATDVFLHPSGSLQATRLRTWNA